jgi:hypothetical protein
MELKFGLVCSKRKRRLKREEAHRKRYKTPEDNAMRQKLRGKPAEESSAREDSSRPATPLQDRVSETESEGLSQDEADPTAGIVTCLWVRYGGFGGREVRRGTPQHRIRLLRSKGSSWRRSADLLQINNPLSLPTFIIYRSLVHTAQHLLAIDIFFLLRKGKPSIPTIATTRLGCVLRPHSPRNFSRA